MTKKEIDNREEKATVKKLLSNRNKSIEEKANNMTFEELKEYYVTANKDYIIEAIQRNISLTNKIKKQLDKVTIQIEEVEAYSKDLEAFSYNIIDLLEFGLEEEEFTDILKEFYIKENLY